jgi:hypothetical protein
MAKSGGLGQRLYVHGVNISTDIQDVSDTGGGFTPLISTDITKLATAREIGGKRDGRAGFNAFFNDAVGQAHDVLSALPTTDVILSWLMSTNLGAPAFSLNAKQVDYNPNRDAEGQLLLATAAVGNSYGGEWGNTLTLGTRTDAGATNGSSIDTVAGTNFGLTAYLHVLAFTGTDVTVKLQQSSDNGVGDAWADVTSGAFTQVTGGAPFAERIQTARNQAVERYLRVVTVTTGGFSNLEFLAIVCKPDVEVQF